MLEQYVLKWIILFYVVCNLCYFVINPFSSICPCKKMITWLHRVPMPRLAQATVLQGREQLSLSNGPGVPWKIGPYEFRSCPKKPWIFHVIFYHFLSRNRRVSPETIQDSRYSPMIFWGPKTCFSNLPRSGYVFNENSKGTCIDLADLAEYFVGLPIHGFDSTYFMEKHSKEY